MIIMFYKKKENWYFWFKSDKDKFWFWPFENDGDFTKLDLNLNNLKTYKNLVWIWKNKLFIFEYSEINWLNIINIKNTNFKP